MKCKSILSILLSATIAAGTLTTPAFAASYPASSSKPMAVAAISNADDFTIEDGVLMEYKGTNETVVIPNSVTSIGSEAFAYNDKITSVTIPNSVLTIEARAFVGCSKLSSITIPNTVTSIEYEAFVSTPWFESHKDFIVEGNSILIAYKGSAANVVIPDTVKSIGDGAFESNETLEKITIPIGVTSIGLCAFVDCSSLKSVDIPYGVTTIGDQAFTECLNLSAVTIPATVTDIGVGAFEDTAWLGNNKSIYVVVGDGILIAYTGTSSNINDIPTTVKSIAGGAFGRFSYEEDHPIKSITVPSSVIKICDYAFMECHSLTTISLPDSVKTIGIGAFTNCEDLGSITIPASVSKIGAEAFISCLSMSAITVDSNNNSYSSQDGILFNKEQTTLMQFPCAKSGSYTIPGTVKTIEETAFASCGGLSSVAIPDSVTVIGDGAFTGCEGLKNITIPGSVLKIGYACFQTCEQLETVQIQEGVKEIGYMAFMGCKALKSANIPSTVAVLNADTFSSCGSLESIHLSEGLTAIGPEVFAECVKLTNIALPLSLKTIDINAFSGCEKLTGVTFPNGLTTIGENAFSGCLALKSIFIPASVTKIGICAFDYCINIMEFKVDANNPNYTSKDGVLFNRDFSTLVNYPCAKKGSYSIPGTVKNIGNSSFYGCEGLSGITIPVGVTKIEDYAFGECTGLKSVVIPNSVTAIGMRAFYYTNEDGKSSGPASITIPGSIEKIGDDAFSGTTWLAKYAGDFVVVGKGLLIKYKGTATDIVIPDNVKTICGHAFSSDLPDFFSMIHIGSGGTTSVYIPGSVKVIDAEAFYGFSSLKSVTISYGVETIGDGAFEMCYNLETISIPKSVTTIGNNLFGVLCDAKIYCVSPSEALDYAKYNEIPYSVINPVTTIKLNSTSLNWVVGKSTKLTPKITPTNATTKDVIWTTSDKKVASVDSAGNVKAISVGKATITCIAKDGNGAKATCTVNVLPGTPANVKAVSASYNSIKLTWSAVNGVSGYEVYRYNGKTKKYDKIKSTTAANFTDTNLTINKSYSYKVRAYKTVNGINYFSDYSAVASTKPQPSVPGSFKVVKASKTSLKISWAAVTGATGYEVYRYSNASEKYVLVKTTSSLSYTNTGLKTKTSYSYKVRAYRTVSGVKYFSGYTAVKSAKPY